MKIVVDANGNRSLRVEKGDFKKHMRTGRPFEVPVQHLAQTNRMSNDTLDTVVALVELEYYLEARGDDLMILSFRAIDRDKVKAQAKNIAPPSKEHLLSNLHVKDVIPMARRGEVYDL